MSIRNYGLISSTTELLEITERIHGNVFGFDIETGYLGPDREKGAVHPETAIVVGISFTDSTDWARYVPLAHDEGENLDNLTAAVIFWDLLATGMGVAHNVAFELRHLARWFRQHLSDDPLRGAAVRASDGYFPIRSDTLIEAYLVAEFERFGLKPLTKALFDHQMTELYDLFTDLPVNKRKFLRFNVLPLEPKVIEYACEDSVWCLAIHERYYPKVKNRDLYAVEMAIVQEVVHGMEDEGICYDWALMARTADKLRTFRDHWNAEIMTELTEMTGQPIAINLASPLQVRKVLFEQLGLRTTVYTTKTRDLPPAERRMSTGDIALRKLATDHPVIKKLLQWREMTKLLGSYLEKYETQFNYADDGRVHANHLTAFVRTGRFAVSDPNYQQCLPGSYQALTPYGWVRLDELADTIPVAQYRSDGGLEFVLPEQVVRSPYTGDMIELRGGEMGWWRYTPNHRLIYKTRDRRSQESGTWHETIKEADAESWETSLLRMQEGHRRLDRQHITSGTRVGGRPNLTGQELLDLRLAVAIQADGTRTNGHQYDIAVHKVRKIERLVNWGLTPEQQSRGRWRLRVPRYKLARWLNENKDFKADAILALNADDLDVFLSEVMFWDGDFTRGATYGQNIARRTSVDVVQAAAALTGHTTSLYERPEFDAVTVNVSRTGGLKGTGWQDPVRVRNEEGMVYCVTVPTGMWLCRNDRGKVMVTGNSPKKYHFDLADARAAHDAGEQPPPGTCFTFNFRDCIIAPPDHYILGFDLSQAELRAIAGEAQEHALLEAFANGDDVHKLTASLMLGVPLDEVTKDQRDVGKTMNFALLYGMSVKGLADRLSIPIDEAQTLMDKYFAGLSAIAAYMTKQKNHGLTHGYVTSRFGRHLPIWEFQSDKPWVRAGGERACVNYPIQGAATGDYMKIAMVRAVRAIKAAGLADKIKLVMNIHDALEFYVHSSIEPRDAIAVLKGAVVFSVPGWPPMKADWHLAKRWGSPTEIDVHDDGSITAAGELPDELKPEVEQTDDGDTIEAMPDVDPEVIREAARPAFDNGRQVIVDLKSMPDRENWRKFVALLKLSAGPNHVTVVTPEGQLEIPFTSALRPDHLAGACQVLGSADVEIFYRMDAVSTLADGLVL